MLGGGGRAGQWYAHVHVHVHVVITILIPNADKSLTFCSKWTNMALDILESVNEWKHEGNTILRCKC